MGWALSSAAARKAPEIESHVVALAGPPRLPRRVQQLTGLTVRELKAASSREHVGGRLAQVVEDAADSLLRGVFGSDEEPQ